MLSPPEKRAGRPDRERCLHAGQVPRGRSKCYAEAGCADAVPATRQYLAVFYKDIQNAGTISDYYQP